MELLLPPESLRKVESPDLREPPCIVRKLIVPSIKDASFALIDVGVCFLLTDKILLPKCERQRDWLSMKFETRVTLTKGVHHFISASVKSGCTRELEVMITDGDAPAKTCVWNMC